MDLLPRLNRINESLIYDQHIDIKRHKNLAENASFLTLNFDQ
jgi:hypothetical protein